MADSHQLDRLLRFLSATIGQLQSLAVDAMASGAHQVIALLQSCRAAYEQEFQHLSPADREQVARYWNSMNSDIRNSASTRQFGTSVPSKRPASGAMFGDMEPSPKRTVCTPTVPPLRFG